MSKKITAFVTLILFIFLLCGCDLPEKNTANDVKKYTSDNADNSVSSENEISSDDNKTSENAETTAGEDDKKSDESSEISSDEEFDESQKKELNIFLSNFSEAGYGTYDLCEEEEKLYFAFIHNSINNKNFNGSYSDDKYAIEPSLVDSTLERFFGKSIAHSTPSGSKYWKYEDGVFTFPASDGESRAYFSTATLTKKNSDGTYNVLFDVYFNSNGPHDPVDPQWYSLTSQEAMQNFEFCYSGEAVLRDKNHEGSATYEMISYTTF